MNKSFHETITVLQGLKVWAQDLYGEVITLPADKQKTAFSTLVLL